MNDAYVTCEIKRQNFSPPDIISVTINSNDYINCTATIGPKPLTLFVRITSRSDLPQGGLAVDSSLFHFDFNPNTGELISKNGPITIREPILTKRFVNGIEEQFWSIDVEIISNDIQNTQNPRWKKGDIYTINYAIKQWVEGGFARRKAQNNTPNPNNSTLTPFNNNNEIEIPIILINGQTLIDGSNIGNVIFTIQDQYQYYNNEIVDNKCAIYTINPVQLQTTIFDKCTINLALVIKGNGDNLYDKLQNIYNTNTIDVPFEAFYSNIFLYAMLKYILSRLLYGNFDIDYLLNKYNKRFLKNLAKSRFCGFLPIFTKCVDNICIYNYNQYFK